jgi:hypothetical protein
MGSSKRSRKYSGVTCSGFSKGIYLLAALLCVSAYSGEAGAETGVVSAVGAGRDTGDAIANLLKVTTSKYFKAHSASLTKGVLQAEILPNASSFVQSYKILEGGRSGGVQLSASVDLDVINGLLSLTPKSLGEEGAVKALVAVRSPKLPDAAVSGMKPPAANAKPADPFSPLAVAARERLSRRDFTDVVLSPEELQAVSAGEDFSSPELLRGLGAKAGARIALGISGRFETYENENSHNKDERLVLAATLLDVKAGNVLGRASVNVVSPKTRREQYLADLQRNVTEESKDLFQDIFVSAGRRLVKPEGQAGFAVVRVQFPSNSGLVMKFKALLEAVPGVRSVTEHSIRRGMFDLAVRPALPEASLAKAVAAMQSPDLQVAVVQASGEAEAAPPALTVKLAPKEEALPQVEGVPSAKY